MKFDCYSRLVEARTRTHTCGLPTFFRGADPSQADGVSYPRKLTPTFLADDSLPYKRGSVKTREGAGFPSGILPVSDVFGLAYVHRPTAIQQCFDRVIIARRQDKFLVHGRRCGLYAGHETSTNPNPRRAIG